MQKRLVKGQAGVVCHGKKADMIQNLTKPAVQNTSIARKGNRSGEGRELWGFSRSRKGSKNHFC